MATCPTEEDNHPKEQDRAPLGTARPNIPMMRTSRLHLVEEGSARPAVANDAVLEYQELDRRPPSPGMVSSNKKNRKNKKKRLMKKNYQKD